jgi:hypothetical protein
VNFIDRSTWVRLCLASISFLAFPLLAASQAAPDMTSTIYHGAYRNALHFIASAHAHAVAGGMDSQSQADKMMCATIGLIQADLNVLLTEDGAFSNDLVSLRATEKANQTPQTGHSEIAPVTPSSDASTVTMAIERSRSRLASRMSPAGLRAFDNYMSSTVIPATHVMSFRNQVSSGEVSR